MSLVLGERTTARREASSEASSAEAAVVDEDIGTPGRATTRNIKSKVVSINKSD
jgi:hypothetical protein